MTVKFELNADMKYVWLRLAKGFEAGMAESERLPRKKEYAGENPAASSILEAEEQESE